MGNSVTTAMRSAAMVAAPPAMWSPILSARSRARLARPFLFVEMVSWTSMQVSSAMTAIPQAVTGAVRPARSSPISCVRPRESPASPLCAAVMGSSAGTSSAMTATTRAATAAAAPVSLNQVGPVPSLAPLARLPNAGTASWPERSNAMMAIPRAVTAAAVSASLSLAGAAALTCGGRRCCPPNATRRCAATATGYRAVRRRQHAPF